MSDPDCVFQRSRRASAIFEFQYDENQTLLRWQWKWKISADIHNIKAKRASDGLSPYCQTCVWHEEGDGTAIGVIQDCNFLCFFSCSPWWSETFEQARLTFPYSCAGQAGWTHGITMLLTNLPLLNRKNGPAGGVRNPCCFAAGGWRTSQQTHDGQEGENHHRTHADREGLYQRPGSLHQGSDSAPEKQAGELGVVDEFMMSRFELTHILLADNVNASTSVSVRVMWYWELSGGSFPERDTPGL